MPNHVRRRVQSCEIHPARDLTIREHGERFCQVHLMLDLHSLHMGVRVEHMDELRVAC